MRKYENQVQKIKNQVYQKVSSYAFDGTLLDNMLKIPEELNAGPNASLRCCVYHERAVTTERVYMSMGGNRENANLVEVLYSACDQCTVNRYVITETCRGCLAHRCQQSCPVDAIYFINNKAVIDNEKCIECGRCHKSCPYNAISDVLRPCIKSCPTKAITMDKHKKAIIDETKCIRCGSCVYSCPFGAIQDKSQITQVIEALIVPKSRLYAIVAPAIATQFDYVDLGQVVTAIKKIGFIDVVEVALGADLVAIHEASEFIEATEQGQDFMTSSCCPGFVRFVHQEFPSLIPNISSTISPMTATARLIKSMDPLAKIVFVGPCIAKKGEEAFFEIDKTVDYILTFEELTGMLSAAKLDLRTLECSPLNNASSVGRKFASSGGVASAVKTLLDNNAYDVVVCDGIAECKKTLTLAKLGKLKNTFIEGMACEGGCIRGPVTMHYGQTDKKKLDGYCQLAHEESPSKSTRILELSNIQMCR